jgi:hypothetical protein
MSVELKDNYKLLTLNKAEECGHDKSYGTIVLKWLWSR